MRAWFVSCTCLLWVWRLHCLLDVARAFTANTEVVCPIKNRLSLTQRVQDDFISPATTRRGGAGERSTVLFMMHNKKKKSGRKSSTSKGFGGSTTSSSSSSSPATAAAVNTRVSQFDRFPYSGTIRSGQQSPQKIVTVPEILKPDYAETGAPGRNSAKPLLPWMIEIKTAQEIDCMRQAGALAREVLDLAGRAVAVGVTTDEIDELVHQETLKVCADVFVWFRPPCLLLRLWVQFRPVSMLFFVVLCVWLAHVTFAFSGFV